ncbi:Nuclear receptor 2C2-associated protein [Varanus komodoensis]|nr:Nuclear receptor 2C2-associated protein [Varanus komodoensis]
MQRVLPIPGDITPGPLARPDRPCSGIAMAPVSLICSETVSRVSSVLNREVKQFGKKYMFDGNEETSWNSDQGATQWLVLEFPRTVQASLIQIQFQGGFASQKCTVQGSRKGEELSQVAEFYPEDTNALQISFLQPSRQEELCPAMGCMRASQRSPGKMDALPVSLRRRPVPSLVHFPLEGAPAADKLKISFCNSTDFFGRIIVYRLEVLGKRF